jgi:OFA family oxalate/formate antiporter-like MFS transporter
MSVTAAGQSVGPAPKPQKLAPNIIRGPDTSARRWLYLSLNFVCMILIANLQYGWTLFVPPMHTAHGWSVSQIQIAFTLFIALETWGTPFNGWLVDHIGPHFGPRIVMGFGGVLVAVGWIFNSYAQTLPELYVGGAVSGIGAGAVYCSAVGTAVKWFKDRRGLAVGLIAGGYGAGAAMTVIPIAMVLRTSGYEAAFFWFGLLQGGVVLIVSQFIRNPNPGEAIEPTVVKVQRTRHSYTTAEMLRSPIFWILYLLDGLMCAGGLTVSADLAPIGAAFQVSQVALFGTTVLAVALVVANVMNGGARPFFGWVSDQIGHTVTMAIAFGLGAVAYYMLTVAGHDPWGFIFFAGLVFFCWGEIFSLFPAMCTDLFGEKYATTNLSVLYTAKGVAALLVPFGSLIAGMTGDWAGVLYIAAGINTIAVVLVLAVLRPAERRRHADEADAARLAVSAAG